MTARLIQVIEVNRRIGEGTVDNPMRTVWEYWSPDGNLLAVKDPERDRQDG